MIALNWETESWLKSPDSFSLAPSCTPTGKIVWPVKQKWGGSVSDLEGEEVDLFQMLCVSLVYSPVTQTAHFCYSHTHAHTNAHTPYKHTHTHASAHTHL